MSTGELDVRIKRKRGVNNDSKWEKNYDITQWWQIFCKKKKSNINSYRTLKTTTATETTTKHGKKVFGNAWAKKSIKE